MILGFWPLPSNKFKKKYIHKRGYTAFSYLKGRTIGVRKKHIQGGGLNTYFVDGVNDWGWENTTTLKE